MLCKPHELINERPATGLNPGPASLRRKASISRLSGLPVEAGTSCSMPRTAREVDDGMGLWPARLATRMVNVADT
jgi:hypothetical protein